MYESKRKIHISGRDSYVSLGKTHESKKEIRVSLPHPYVSFSHSTTRTPVFSNRLHPFNWRISTPL